MKSEEIERSLEEQIEPWLAHMRWRKDFTEWRKKRLWQEKYQSEALADIHQYAGDAAADTRVLDLGAGMGGFAVAFALSTNGSTRPPQPGASLDAAERHIFAMDYNPAYCEITRTRALRYRLDLPVLAAAGENLPFKGDEFGILACWDVVEHVQDPERVVAEIARVLKPGGCAFLTVINRLALVDPHYHLRFVNWLPRPLGDKYIDWRQRTKASPLRDRQRLGEMHYFTYRSIVNLAAKFGLDVRDLNASRSRFSRLPGLVGEFSYLTWRTFGMGTYRLLLTKRKTG